MTKSVLVVIDYPFGENRQDEQKVCKGLLDDAEEKAKTAKGIQKIGERAWLIDVQNGLSFLTWLIAAGNERKLKPRTMFLHDHSDWIQEN